MQKLLLVDDDISFCSMLKKFLERKGFNAFTAFSYQEAVALLSKNKFDVVLTDFRLPDKKDGLDVLKEIKSRNPESIVILMTAYADIRTAVKAIKMGAFEYVTKPVNPDEIILNIKKGLEKRNQEIPEPIVAKAPTNKPSESFDYVYGDSAQSESIHDHISLVAPTDMSVIIQGESGTGKEYIARKIHLQSKRKGEPFVAIDCGALSKELAGSEFFGHIKGSFTGAFSDKTGQFETANKGTLFLDEIGNLSYEIQVKLLRAIQERKIRKIGSTKDIRVDVRILTATNEDLLSAVQKGNFREDLYHRLNEFSIRVAPLRERKEDVNLFSQYFLKKANEELEKNVFELSPEVMDIFYAYSWPGNIREIKNVIKRAVLLSKQGEITQDCLPLEILDYVEKNPGNPRGTDDLRSLTGENEKEIIIQTLQKAQFNKSKAAKMLKIDRKTLYNKIKNYGIEL